MSENNQMMSVEGQLVGMPLAGPESFSQQQLDYLKHALGIDETVLWVGSKTSPTGDAKINISATISEPLSNFEYVKVFYWFRRNDSHGSSWRVSLCYVEDGAFQFTHQWPESATGNWYMYRLYGSGTTITGDGGYKAAANVNTFGSYTGGMWGNGTPWKLVGIHRISGGNQ